MTIQTKTQIQNNDLSLLSHLAKQQEVYNMDIELYCCYSLPLRNYLRNNGIRYKLCALNPNSKQRFWVYIKDEKLHTLLNGWTANK